MMIYDEKTRDVDSRYYSWSNDHLKIHMNVYKPVKNYLDIFLGQCPIYHMNHIFTESFALWLFALWSLENRRHDPSLVR